MAAHVDERRDRDLGDFVVAVTNPGAGEHRMFKVCFAAVAALLAVMLCLSWIQAARGIPRSRRGKRLAGLPGNVQQF